MNNILEVTNLADLRTIMESNVTVILGLTIESISENSKIMIRKFLKRKSEGFPLITFVYMEVCEEDRESLSILKGDYPKIYHIRDGNKILLNVDGASEEDIYDSFDSVKKYYLNEMSVLKNNNSDTCDDDENLTDIANNDIIESNEEDGSNIKSDNIIVQQNVKIDPVLEKKKNLDKLVLLNNKYDKMQIDLVNEVKRRKKLESINKKKKKKKDSSIDSKDYRKSRRGKH